MQGGHDDSWLGRRQQAHAFARLTSDGTSGDTAAALRKRLLRAKKFWLLTRQFGEGVLDLVPLVCVSRVDTVPLGILGHL